MNRTVRWDAVKVSYMNGRSKEDAEIAKEHGISTAALRRRVRKEGWEVTRLTTSTRKYIEETRAALAYSRKQAILAAQHMIKICRDRTLDIRTLHYESREAEWVFDVSYKAAILVKEAAHLQELEAGRMPDYGAECLPGDPRWDRPGSWHRWEGQLLAYRSGRRLRFGRRPGKPGPPPVRRTRGAA